MEEKEEEAVGTDSSLPIKYHQNISDYQYLLCPPPCSLFQFWCFSYTKWNIKWYFWIWNLNLLWNLYFEFVFVVSLIIFSRNHLILFFSSPTLFYQYTLSLSLPPLPPTPTVTSSCCQHCHCYYLSLALSHGHCHTDNRRCHWHTDTDTLHDYTALHWTTLHWLDFFLSQCRHKKLSFGLGKKF